MSALEQAAEVSDVSAVCALRCGVSRPSRRQRCFFQLDPLLPCVESPREAFVLLRVVTRARARVSARELLSALSLLKYTSLLSFGQVLQRYLTVYNGPVAYPVTINCYYHILAITITIATTITITIAITIIIAIATTTTY